MVIINKPIAKRFRQEKRKKPFVKVLGVILSMLIILSTVIMAIPLASAKGESPFVDCEEIFIDMRSFTGWTGSSASFRVFTFYNDSDNANYCHEFEGNFDNDGWYTGANVLGKGIVPVKFCNNVYSFRIPANNISHLRIVRTNSSGTEKWNLSPYMWDNQRNKYSAGGKNYSKQNAIKITGWDNNASWSTFTPTNNASYSETTAVPDSSITGNSSLYTIDSTFYDYYNDDEIQNGWGNIRYATNHGTQKYSQNGNGYMENAYWEPFSYLNSKIAAHDSEVNYPLYFGNFFDKEDGFKGEGSSEMEHFSNWVNNSSRLGGTQRAVVGLTGKTLDSDGDLVYAVNGGSNSSTKVPIFDKSWLKSNKVGSVVNTKFPMRMVTSNGVTGYYFDSSSSAANGGDNVWFNSSHNTISYGAGTSNGAKDSLSYYNSDGSSSGYGFFPFDSTRGQNANALDYGFGMRVDVKFNLGADDSSHIGQIKGTNDSYVDQKFNFTGDDDVWVYIDGKLVLDLGGDHQKADGSINFHDLSVSVSHGTNVLNGASRNGKFTLDNYGDPTAEHTLTMFYVERGMVESNLSFNFNFAPVGNEFIVDKTVNTAKVNEGIQSAVAAADTFSFNQPTANGKVSSKGTISNSTYTLTDGESIRFKNQFTRGQNFIVTESESNLFDYTTTWSAKDLEMNESLGSGTGKEARFTYDTSNTSEFAMTRVQLSYVNTPAVADVTIKKIVDGLGGATDNTEFGGTVYVDLGDGNGFKTYDLTYTTGGSTYKLTSAGQLATGGKLKNGRELTFSGIPQGAKVMFVEDAAPSGYSFVSVTGDTNGITVRASGNDITVTNKKLSGGGTLNVTKKLDGENYTGGAFSFTAEGVSKTGYVTGSTVHAYNAVNGTVSFALTFTQPGEYLYKITEDELSQELQELGYYKDRSTIYAKFTVVSDASGLKISGTPKYYSDEACTTPVTAVFRNTTEHAKIMIKKTTDKGSAEGNVFAVVKVKDSTPLSKDQINNLIKNDSAKYVKGTTLNDGSLEFDNLPIYQNGEQVYDNGTSQWIDGADYMDGIHTPQTYMVFEYSPKNGYNTNNTVKFVTFPYQGQYNVTFDYVNLAVINPASGFGGTMRFFVIGLSVLGTAALLAMAYVFYKKRRVKATYAPRHGRK